MMVMKTYRLWIIMLLSFVVISCHDDDEPEIVTNDRTVLVYMIAENSLGDVVGNFAVADIMEMLHARYDIPKGSELLVYLDDLKEPRIYCINNKTEAQTLYELKPEYSYEEDVNSCGKENVSSVLDYMVKRHSAKNYGVVFWSHGSGWIQRTNWNASMVKEHGRKTSFGIDNGENHPIDKGYQMEIEDISEVFSKYGQFEFAMFDACFMQCVEVAYELRNNFKYIIASPAEIPGPGAPYDFIMSDLFASNFDASRVAKDYYEYYAYGAGDYGGALISAVETSKIGALAEATKKALKDVVYDESKLNGVLDYFIYDSWKKYASFFPDFYDIKGLMQAILPQETYNEWRSSLDDCVVGFATNYWYTQYPPGGANIPVNHSQYSGISMFLPLNKYVDDQCAFVDKYYNTAWWKVLND